MRIISLAVAAAIAGGTLLVAQPAQAACQATQSSPSTNAIWSNNCTVSTSANQTSDLTTAIQGWLNSEGYWVDIDGVFGSKTRSAVIEAQKWLFPTDSGQWDGVVGPKTWAKMDSKLVGYLPTSSSSYYQFDVRGSELGQGLYRLYRSGDRKGMWYTLRSTCSSSGGFAPMDSSRSCS